MGQSGRHTPPQVDQMALSQAPERESLGGEDQLDSELEFDLNSVRSGSQTRILGSEPPPLELTEEATSADDESLEYDPGTASSTPPLAPSVPAIFSAQEVEPSGEPAPSPATLDLVPSTGPRVETAANPKTSTRKFRAAAVPDLIPALDVRPSERRRAGPESRAPGPPRSVPAADSFAGALSSPGDLDEFQIAGAAIDQVAQLHSSSPPSTRAAVGGAARANSAPSPIPPGAFELDGLGDQQAAQMEVAVPAQEKETVGWPSCRTPTADEVSISSGAIEQDSGLGPPPEHFWATPAYAVGVLNCLRQLAQKQSFAQKALQQAEASRDDQLGRLAEANRLALAKNDRFENYYAEMDRLAGEISHRRTALAGTDAQAAANLAQLQEEVEGHLERQRVCQEAQKEKQQAVDANAVDISRLEASLRRLEIEERNLHDREERSGPQSRSEFDVKFSALEDERHALEEKLEHARRRRKELALVLRKATDDWNLAAAERQTSENKREGLLVALESELYDDSRALDHAAQLHQEARANLGRAIIELKGQVPVPASARLALMDADALVHKAATHRYALAATKDAIHTPSVVKGLSLLALTAISLGWLLLTALF